MSDGEGNNEKAEIIEERNMYNLSKEFIDIIGMWIYSIL